MIEVNGIIVRNQALEATAGTRNRRGLATRAALAEWLDAHPGSTSGQVGTGIGVSKVWASTLLQALMVEGKTSNDRTTTWPSDLLWWWEGS